MFGRLLALCVLLGCLSASLAPPAALAEEDAIDAYARWITRSGKWKGPTVVFPDSSSRPGNMAHQLHSLLRPVAVHAPSTVAESRVVASLEALEFAYDLMLETGWPLPSPDGGRGAGPGFDLYLDPSLKSSARAHVDAALSWSHLDGASTFASIDPAIDEGRLQACVVAALAEASLLGQDPAEDASWRRATGAYLAWLATGHFGCNDEVVLAQQQPWRGWFGADVEAGAGLFLAMLCERQDGGSSTFVRELWQFARQRSDDAVTLRASPNFWQAMVRALENVDESLEQIIEDVAVARYFTGQTTRRAGAAYRVLSTLPSDAAVLVQHRIALAQLPAHLPPAEPSLGTLGSEYTIIDTKGAGDGDELKVWLRGELRARWSLIAVRIGADGRELGRLSAPARRLPKSYLPLTLTADTHSVLLVVTRLPLEQDTLEAEVPEQGYRLILDR